MQQHPTSYLANDAEKNSSANPTGESGYRVSVFSVLSSACLCAPMIRATPFAIVCRAAASSKSTLQMSGAVVRGRSTW